MRLEAAEQLLCRSAAFRQKLGAGNEAATAARVYAGELSGTLDLVAGGTLELKRPCAIIGINGHSYVQIGQGSTNQMQAVGAVWLLFIDNPEHKTNYKLSLLAFTEWVSKVMDEIAGDLGGDQWPFTSIRNFSEPMRPDIADRESDDFWMIGYVLDDTANGGGQI
jgi:hypothetical protein